MLQNSAESPFNLRLSSLTNVFFLYNTSFCPIYGYVYHTQTQTMASPRQHLHSKLIRLLPPMAAKRHENRPAIPSMPVMVRSHKKRLPPPSFSNPKRTIAPATKLNSALFKHNPKTRSWRANYPFACPQINLLRSHF